MNTAELVELLDTAEEALKANEEYVTPELLDKIANGITMAEGYKDIIRDLLSLDDAGVDKLFVSLQKFLDFEREFVKSEKGENAIKAISNLKSRPIILRIVASSLN